MRRRDVLVLMAAIVAPWSLEAGAETPKVIAFVLPAASPAEMAGRDPAMPVARFFVHALRDLGWEEGRNVVIERHSPEGRPERAPAIFAELRSRHVDVVAIGASPWLIEAARQAMPTTPIVTVFAEDPVETGLVASLARPGGTITGVTGSIAPEITGKRLQLLKELAPGISRVAVLGTTKAWTLYRDRVDTSDEDEMLFIPLESPEQLEGALASVLREGADGLVVQAGATAYVHAQRIVDFAAANRLPAIYTFREPVEGGGLISYGINVERLFGQLAGFADRILRGSHPAETPVELPTRFETVVNVTTARDLGLTVPQSLLLLADEVIE
jgi:putative tryptophan/tyrosine transport system substrate-binding protein